MYLHPSRPAETQRGIKGLETVFAGIKEVQSSLEPRGSMIAYRSVLSDGTNTV